MQIHPSLRPGAVVFGLGMIGFGLIALVRLDAVPSLEPLPSFLAPSHAIVGVISAAILIVAGGLLVSNVRAPRAAFCVAAFLALWGVALQVPVLAAHPTNGGLWVGAFEVVAISAGGWMLAAALARTRSSISRTTEGWEAVATAARIAFGISFLAFGASHFMYAAYVESVTPKWIPWHPFWAYAIGVAHVAAGVSFLTRVQARLASILLAVMFGSWVIIVHAPRVAAARGNQNEWTSLVVAVAMCGAALVFFAALAGRPTTRG